MESKFFNLISTKNLYLVTLKQLVDVEVDTKKWWVTNYIMSKRCEYVICKKKGNRYYDIFTNTEYKLIQHTEQGEYGVRSSMPLTYEKKFISSNELADKLKEIREQSDNSHELNIKKQEQAKANQLKSKKLIPFPKKY